MQLSGSANARHYLARSAQTLRLLRRRGPEEWSETICDLPETEGMELLGVTTQGDLFFRDRAALYRVRGSRGNELEQIPLGDSEGELGRIRIDAGGQIFAVETITPEGGLKGKLKKFFPIGTTGPDREVHRVQVKRLDSPMVFAFKFVTETELTFHFHWHLSPGGRFLAVAVPSRQRCVIQLVDVVTESVLEDFELSGPVSRGVWVADSGILLVDDGEGSLILGQPRAGFMPISFQPPAQFEVLHLAEAYVAVRVRDLLQLYNFQGELLAEVRCQDTPSFCSDGAIELLRWTDGLAIQRATPATLSEVDPGPLTELEPEDEPVFMEEPEAPVEVDDQPEREEEEKPAAAPRFEPPPDAPPSPLAGRLVPGQRGPLEEETPARPEPPPEDSPPEEPLSPEPAAPSEESQPSFADAWQAALREEAETPPAPPPELVEEPRVASAPRVALPVGPDEPGLGLSLAAPLPVPARPQAEGSPAEQLERLRMLFIAGEIDAATFQSERAALEPAVTPDPERRGPLRLDL